MTAVLRAERTKLRTVAGPGWLLVAAIALTAVAGALASNAVSCPAGGCLVDPAKVSLTGMYLGQAVVAIVAVTAVSGEYSTGMIRLTLTATPRRWLVLAAKAAVALLGLDIAAAVRDSAVSIGVVLGLLFLLPIIAGAVGDADWKRHLDQISPMTAGMYIQATTDLRSLPLTPWQGLGVLAAWAAGGLLVGGLLLRLRDA
jgi:ABC-2 type transport system permease protein